MRVALRRVSGKWWLAAVALLLAALLFHLAFQGGFQSLSFQIVAWQRDLHRALTLAITELSGAPSPPPGPCCWGSASATGSFMPPGRATARRC